MDARYRRKEDKQTKFVHTLNGSGVQSAARSSRNGKLSE